ncbi:hypothetical protein R3P38DRAFT_3214161 [Favolaschia claudopus]|uniref:Uncharacterized protein n=1 Tax=Favolaschia claudopus TaxID=2862362 RepID=A0AAW0AB93_9AGAR
MSKPGRKSKFNAEQETHIVTLFPTLWGKYQSMSSVELTQWKNERIEEIMQLELFSGLASEPPNGTDKKGWKNVSFHYSKAKRLSANLPQRILKKFNNHIKDMKSAPAFLQLPPVTGFDLFGLQQRTTIRTAAANVATQASKRLLDCIDERQRSMWTALSSEQQAEYDRQALKVPSNVETNQAVFPQAATKALNDICRGGLVGNIELCLFWAHRETNGDLRYGVVNSHSSEGVPDMVAGIQGAFDMEWARHANSVIPASINNKEILVPRNLFGVPIFPFVCVKDYMAPGLSVIVNCYLVQLWAYCRSDEIYPPWPAIAADGDAFYDTSRFKLPGPLKAPDELSASELFALAEHFILTATVTAKDPFVFRPAQSQIQSGGLSQSLLNPNIIAPSPQSTPDDGFEGSDLTELDVNDSTDDPTPHDTGHRRRGRALKLPQAKEKKSMAGKKRSVRSPSIPGPSRKQHIGTPPYSRRSRRNEPSLPTEMLRCWMHDGFAYPEGGNPPPGHDWDEPHEWVLTVGTTACVVVAILIHLHSRLKPDERFFD